MLKRSGVKLMQIIPASSAMTPYRRFVGSVGFDVRVAPAVPVLITYPLFRENVSAACFAFKFLPLLFVLSTLQSRARLRSASADLTKQAHRLF